MDISIHALLAESDRGPPRSLMRLNPFLSTLSLRRATNVACGDWHKLRYFYPRSPCGERLKPCCPAGPGMPFLSTLSLRRATRPATRPAQNLLNFYPRSPCGERQCPSRKMGRLLPFLSTLSLRRATIQPHQGPGRPPISIHALLAESDPDAMPLTTSPLPFLSTLSLRRATSDCLWRANPSRDFYPRSPCGERRRDRKADVRNSLFLSTLSLRRATVQCGISPQVAKISIHALLAESDRVVVDTTYTGAISIHALLAESDAGQRTS